MDQNPYESPREDNGQRQPPSSIIRSLFYSIVDTVLLVTAAFLVIAGFIALLWIVAVYGNH